MEFNSHAIIPYWDLIYTNRPQSLVLIKNNIEILFVYLCITMYFSLQNVMRIPK